MKNDEEVDAKGITDEMQEAATDAFAAHKNDQDTLALEDVAGLLRALDLLKYMPEATERAEWEEMITEEVTGLETQLAQAQQAAAGTAEQLAAKESAFALLQEEKNEGDVRT